MASPRARAVVGSGAMLVSALLVVRATAATPGGTRLAILLGGMALALQALGLTRMPGAAAPAAALLGTVAALALAPDANRGLAIELAVLFLAACELSAWAARLRSVIPETAASVRHELGVLGAVLAGGGVVSAAVLAAGPALEGPRGRGALVLGLAAAAVPVAVLAMAIITTGRLVPARRRRA